MDLTKSMGLMRIGRAALVTLHSELNSLLTSSESGWDAEDATFANSMGISIPGITLEQCAHWYHGHVPSLAKADADMYPNVACFAYSSNPKAGDLGDHMKTVQDTLFIEYMVKSVTSEEEVNARAQRMGDAIFALMIEHEDLDGLVPEMQTSTPRFIIGDVIEREEIAEDVTTQLWWWQGGRFEYLIDKNVPLYVNS